MASSGSRPSLTRLASAYRHRKIPADPSSPLRIKISHIRFAQVGRSSYFSRCPYDRYPDCPRPQPPLAAEDNLNPECAEERLCPTQPASACPGALWPARPVDPDLQKIGCASSPLRSVCHDLADNGRHGIVVDDIPLGVATPPPRHRQRPLLSFAHTNETNIGLLPVLTV
jgi:hypothetical protein